MCRVEWLPLKMEFFQLFFALIILLFAILHGLSAMGFPLLATIVLALFMPMSKVITLLAIPTLLINLLVVLYQPKTSYHVDNTSVNIKPYLPLIIASIIGGILGLKLLLILPTVWLSFILGVTILLSSVHGILSLKYQSAKQNNSSIQNPKKLSMLIAGFLAGLIGSATNAMSPILLFYLFKQSDDKRLISKVSNICYLLSKILQIILLWQTFLLFNQKDWLLLVVLCILAIIGVLIGLKFQQNISQILFKKLIYGILLLLSIKMIWGSYTVLF